MGGTVGTARRQRWRPLAVVLPLTIAMLAIVDSHAQVPVGADAGGRELRLELPLVVDGRPLGEIAATMGADQMLKGLDWRGLTVKLERLVAPATLSRLGAAVGADGLIGLAELAAAGLRARYDEREVQIELAVPAELRRVSRIGLRGRQPTPGPEGLAPPADVSAQLSVLSSLEYVHQGRAGIDEGRQPANLHLDGALNVRGVVLESQLDYDEASPHPWRRDGSRVVLDDPARAVRLAAGDLSYPVTGFQSFRSLAGLTVARNFDLQPYRVTEPAGQHAFTLKRESEVEVLVNGSRVQVLRLAPGRYDLTDFPLAQGSNDVRLRITDATGQVSVVDLSLLLDSDLLAEGVHEFAYSIGIPSEIEDGRRVYRTGGPAFSAFHRLGLSDRLTVGANLQGDDGVQMAGLEAILASAWGNVGLDLAASHAAGAAGGAASLRYELLRPATAERRGFNLSAGTTWQSADFARLGLEPENNTVALNSFARFSRALDDDTSLGIGASHQLGRRGRGDGYDVNLSLSRRITDTVSGELRLSHARDPEDGDEFRAFVSLFIRLPAQRQFVQASHDTDTGSTVVDWQYLPRHSVRDPYGDVTVFHDDDGYGIGGNLYYNDYRFEAQLGHQFAIDRTGEGLDERDVRSRVRFATALVFADGHLALSRPVFDSFAIVAAHPRLAGQEIGVEPSEDRYRGEIDALGPAVVHDLSSYQVRAIRVDAPGLPLGYELGPALFDVAPGYRQGVLIRVGSDATVLIDGRLVDPSGQPIALAAGSARPADGGGGQPIAFFTNRGGRFRIDGARPGRYELSLLATPGVSAAVVVPAEAVGQYRVGEVTYPRAKRN